MGRPQLVPTLPQKDPAQLLEPCARVQIFAKYQGIYPTTAAMEKENLRNNDWIRKNNLFWHISLPCPIQDNNVKSPGAGSWKEE